MEDEVRYTDSDAVVEVRDAQRRELDIRIVPFNTVITHELGPEMFVPGAFEGVDPRKVMLKGIDSEGTHRGPIVGRGLALEERDDGAYMTFKVSRTQAGDELLTLVADEVVKGASIGFSEKPGGHSTQQREGRRIRVQQRVGLDHVVPTWRPAYDRAEIVAMRSETEGEPNMPQAPETEVAAAATPVLDITPLTTAMSALQERSEQTMTKILDRVEKLEERDRSTIIVPVNREEKPVDRKIRLLDWMDYSLRSISGLPVGDREYERAALDDIKTTDNPGVVPDALISDIIGILDSRRPFLASTRQIAAPDTGMSIVVPVLGQRSTAAVQSTEKTDIDSTALKVTNQSFDAVTIAGGADVSIQMIRRASRSYLDLLISDLGMALATEEDVQAVATLFDAGTTPGTADIDPENLQIGEAWANSINSFGAPPDTIWLSSDGVTAFIDAKNDGTNAPLYFTLNGNFGVGNAPAGTVSALRPVYVPAFNGTGVDAMIGPSQGFAWAEDGSFQLTADNPTKAGRDIALVSILFFIPRYPAAFTTYDLGS